ncbi:MAG: hypothetical protein HOP28_08590 [Gemmatimonadales bacterium]|nr:hypothetical protein [Gemmatimonadales bacterium]
MRATSLALRLGAIAGILHASPAPAQSGVPLVRLTKPDAVSAEGFNAVSGLAELKGGRVVGVDGRDGVIRLIDYAKGTVSQVGRSGNGPGEYRGPGGALTLNGDTVWVTSVFNRRILGITPDGEIASAVEVPVAAMFSGRAGYNFSAFLGRDPAGHFYWESFNFDPARPMGQFTLTADIYRWRQGTETAEVVRTIVFRDKDFPIAFNRRDGWSVAPDGSVAFVYGADYHVEWVGADGAVTKGAPTAYERIKVTEHEREEWTRERAAAGGAGRSLMTGPPGQRASGPAPAPRPAPDIKFPEEKPPFPDRNGVWVSREGELWVVTSGSVDAKTTLVDVFDRAGKRVRQVELPAKSRVAGFGVKTVYLAREDDDGVLWIDRHRLP